MAQKIIIHSDNITSVSYNEIPTIFVVHKPEKRNLFGKVVRKAGYYKVRPFVHSSYRYEFVGESKPLPKVYLKFTLKGSHDVDVYFWGDDRANDANACLADILGRMKVGEKFVIYCGDDNPEINTIEP